MRHFEAWEQRRGRLIAVLEELAAQVEATGNPRAAANLRLRAEALGREVFRLMVVGEFKRGKSTLINAMIGAPVLPAKVAPCTAALTVLRHGPRPRAWIVPEQGEAYEVEVEALRDYVLREERKEGLGLRRIEVEVPLPLLAHGVEIIDSPGLNEHRLRSEIALDFLPRSDALIVVLSCEQALAATEMAFLHEQVGERLRHVFFVWNRYDAIAGNPADIADLEATTARWLTPMLDPACEEPRVHPVSARQALLARSQGGTELAASGIIALEAALEGFLGRERLPVKLSGPASAAEGAVVTLRAYIDEHERLLDVPLVALSARYAALAPDLAALEEHRVGIRELVDTHRARLSAHVTEAWEKVITRLRAQLPEVVAAVDLTPVSVFAGRGPAEERLTRAVDRWFGEELEQWESAVLRPLVAEELQSLQNALEPRLLALLGAVDSIREALRPDVRVRVEGHYASPSARDRMIGALGGLLLGGVGAAMEGAVRGPEGMLNTLAWHLSLGLGLVAAGVAAPVVLAAGAALGAARLLWHGLSGASLVRAAVVEATDQALETTRANGGASLEVKVEARFLEIGAQIDSGAADLIQSLRQQVEQVLAEQAEGEQRVARARAELKAQGERLRELQDEIEASRGEPRE